MTGKRNGWPYRESMRQTHVVTAGQYSNDLRRVGQGNRVKAILSNFGINWPLCANQNCSVRRNNRIKKIPSPDSPGGWGFEQRRDDPQRSLGLNRYRARRNARLQRLQAATHEVTAPQANRVLAHGKRLGDAPAGPASKRQQHRPRSVSLATITRSR